MAPDPLALIWLVMACAVLAAVGAVGWALYAVERMRSERLARVVERVRADQRVIVAALDQVSERQGSITRAIGWEAIPGARNRIDELLQKVE